MNYKSKTNKINNVSRAMLALRIIDTVIKSGIADAVKSKAFVTLVRVNEQYQKAIEPGNEKQVRSSIEELYSKRKKLFLEIYDYLEGLLNSPDTETRAAATLLFEQVSKYGRVFRRTRIADQSHQYNQIIGSVKKVEYTDALIKTLLTEKTALLEQAQLDYEELYMGVGNSWATKVAPTTLRNELNKAIKVYMEEVNWMAMREDSEQWTSLKTNLQQRFDEMSVSTRKQADSATEQSSSETTAA